MSSVAVESSVPLYRLKHKWTVKDFAATYLVKSAGKTDYPRLNSTWFSSLDSNVKFRVLLRPRGHHKESQDYLGLYLDMERSPPSPYLKSVDVKFQFSLLNEHKEKYNTMVFQKEFVYPSGAWGLPTFLKHSQLQDPVNGLLPGDQLIILVEIDVLQEHTVNLKDEPQLAKLKARSIESSRATLFDLVHSGEHSDVTLMVEGKEIAAHKALLSAGSPVFKAMFQSEMTELKEGKVMIPDMEEAVAWQLLEFIYTGYAEDLEEYAEELLVAADKYGVIRLKEQCVEYLCGQVDTENSARLFALADRHSVGQLKTVTVGYIRAHWEEVMTRPEDWKSVQDLFLEELRQLKLKEEKEETKKDDRVMPQEESESTN